MPNNTNIDLPFVLSLLLLLQTRIAGDGAGPDDVYPPPSITPARRRRPNEGKCYVLTLFLLHSLIKLNVSAIYLQSRSFGCVTGGKFWLARWIVQLPYLSRAAPKSVAISL